MTFTPLLPWPFALVDREMRTARGELCRGFCPYQSSGSSCYDALVEAGAGMRRREFISLIGAAAKWPLEALAQHAANLPLVAVMHPFTAKNWLLVMTVRRMPDDAAVTSFSSFNEDQTHDTTGNSRCCF